MAQSEVRGALDGWKVTFRTWALEPRGPAQRDFWGNSGSSCRLNSRSRDIGWRAPKVLTIKRDLLSDSNPTWEKFNITGLTLYFILPTEQKPC
eukprot:scaffold77547_cov39-Phaeocystis_antarctica.AAC.2